MTGTQAQSNTDSGAEGGGAEQRATWTELFFDLVVVAGVGQLTHLLHNDPSLADLALYALLYFAFWTVWTSFTVYGAVEAERASTFTMLVGMLGMAVIAASVAGIRGSHAPAFIIGYVLLRWFAGRLWRRGVVVIDWPLAQLGVGTLPWAFSLLASPPVRYWLWALGLALDFVILFTVSGSRLLSGATARMERLIKRRGTVRDAAPTIEAAYANAPHLTERLGLYVIIVLGEGFIQTISAGSGEAWHPAAIATGLAAFTLLTGLWLLSLIDGFAGIPQLRAVGALGSGPTPLRRILLLHCVTTAVIAALDAGLGEAVKDAGHTMSPGTRWLLCGATAAYAVIGLIAGLMTGSASPRLSPLRPLIWALPGLVIPLVLGVFGEGAGTGWLVWALTATLFWPVLCRRSPLGTPGARTKARSE
jgi:low temperature requirement protein LtrA